MLGSILGSPYSGKLPYKGSLTLVQTRGGGGQFYSKGRRFLGSPHVETRRIHDQVGLGQSQV